MEMTRKLAYLAGALRDGSLPEPYNNLYEIQFSQKNRKWLRRIKNFLEELFPEKDIKIVQYGKQTPRIKIYSKRIYLELLDLLEFKGDQSLWRVPSCIRNGSKEIKRWHLKGFFDAEGEVPLSRNQSRKYKVWVRFHHSWKGRACLVLKDLKRILEEDFRIECGEVSGPKEETNAPSFDLAIYGENAKEFYERIGTLHPNHKRRFKIQFSSS